MRLDLCIIYDIIYYRNIGLVYYMYLALFVLKKWTCVLYMFYDYYGIIPNNMQIINTL